MANITLKVTGIDELETFLNQTAPAALTQGLQDALNDLRNEIESTTSNLCPVDTGALLHSIDIEVSGYDLTARADEDYASYVDQGTRFMDAQPFFEDPINDAVDQFQQDIEQKIISSLQNKT